MKRLFAWWDSHTLPKKGANDTPAERERMRYARFINRFTLLILVIGLLDIPLLLISADDKSKASTLIALSLMVLALVFTRFGLIVLAGSCCVLCAIVADAGPVIAPVNGLDISLLPVFNYLVIALLLAGSLLPPISVFFVAALNCSIITFCIIAQKHTPALDTLLNTGGGISAVIVPPLILQVVVAVITYVIIRSLLQALRRADRAEEIAKLQKEIVEHERLRSQEKQQLEEGIRKIAQIHSCSDLRKILMGNSVPPIS